MKKCCRCKKDKPLDEFTKIPNGYISYCKPCASIISKKWYRDHPEKSREKQLKYCYGITLEQYNKLYIEQNGCCLICGKHQNELKKKLHVDHNHTTGEVRGLLCQKCNFLISQADEDINILLKAIKYLEYGI